MTDLAPLIDAYPSLSPDERAAVDARVAEHPEWAEALADAQRLAALVDAATAPVDADDLAQRAAARHLGLPLSDERPEADDARWATEAERIEARLGALGAGAEDPVLRFERLLSESTAEGAGPDRDASPAAPRPLFRPAPNRPALRLLRARRWAVAATVLLVAYGGLFAVSSATVPERARMAALGEVDATAPLALRGGTVAAPSDAVPAADRLTAAFDAIDDARHTTLGLFPTYDDAGLAAAAAQLEDLSGDVDSTSWVSHEARFALGRVLFYQGHDAEAARVLGGLVEQGSYRGAAARRLLDAIRAGT